MDTRKIKKLIELVKETGIGELEVKFGGDESVRISTIPPQTTSPAAPSTQVVTQSPTTETPSTAPAPSKKSEKKHETPEGHPVKSPMVGTVYLASKPGSPPFVAIGQRVKAGDTLCLIEAMKMFNKIEADQAGVVSARLIENEQPVEYEQPLFIIDTDQ